MRTYIDKPSKDALKLRQAHAIYENVLKKQRFHPETTEESRKAALRLVIQAVPYKHNPSMTYAKNFILKHLKL